MIRQGLYAVYDGEEFVAAPMGGDVYVLRSDRPHTGFSKSDQGDWYRKRVTREALQRLFYVRTQAILCGQRVQLIHGQGDSIVACTDDATVAAATSMQRVGRHDYRRTVRLEEVSSLQEQQREA